MMKRLMTGLLAVGMGFALAQQVQARGVTLKLTPGTSCGVYSGQEELLRAKVARGQYVYVQWNEIGFTVQGLDVNPGDPNVSLLDENGEFDRYSALGVEDYIISNWYIYHIPESGVYGFQRNDKGYVPDLSVVRMCFLNQKVPVEMIPMR